MTRWQLHVENWSSCTRCELSDGRRKAVLARGKLPCDVLFVGEAPGESEDVIGSPFCGPAGKLLDRIIESAMPLDPEADALGAPDPQMYSCAFTNVVACIPRDPETGGKAAQPLPAHIKACRPRLQELIEGLAKPRMIVTVGKLADDWAPDAVRNGGPEKWCSIVHPAAILRANEAQKQFMVQRATVVLANALEDLCCK